MKFLIITLLPFFLAASSSAQTPGSNDCADSITGLYFVSHNGEDSKVRIEKQQDGTYYAIVAWVKNRLDKEGNVRLDEKNPDKALRSTPCDKITLVEGLRYNPDKKRWDQGKIYDPTRGIKANATCYFESGTELKIRGTLLGFGETIIWKKIE